MLKNALRLTNISILYRYRYVYMYIYIAKVSRCGYIQYLKIKEIERTHLIIIVSHVKISKWKESKGGI